MKLHLKLIWIHQSFNYKLIIYKGLLMHHLILSDKLLRPQRTISEQRKVTEVALTSAQDYVDLLKKKKKKVATTGKEATKQYNLIR